jgi:hypothetical protein
MSTPVYRVLELLCEIVHDLPIGTNLGVLHLLWTILSGRLLEGLPLALQVAGHMLNVEAGYGFSVSDLPAELREGAKLLVRVIWPTD